MFSNYGAKVRVLGLK